MGLMTATVVYSKTPGGWSGSEGIHVDVALVAVLARTALTAFRCFGCSVGVMVVGAAEDVVDTPSLAKALND